MQLESLDVQSFRNLQGGISCGRGLNILVGENGQGKTNWLEAICVLASTRSFRTTKLQEAINFGEDAAFVRGNVRESPEIVRELRVVIQGNIKTLLLNDKKETVQRYLGQLHAVVFNANCELSANASVDRPAGQLQSERSAASIDGSQPNRIRSAAVNNPDCIRLA